MSKTKKNLFFLNVLPFIDRMRAELKSECTIDAYRDSLNDFRKFLTLHYHQNIETLLFDLITPEVIRHYLSWLLTQDSSLNTRNLRLSAIKSYVRFCASTNIELLTLELQLTKIKTKRVHAQRHNWLNKEQIKLILRQPPTSKIGIRDRFIMMFLFSTGVRLDELLHLKIQDISVEGSYPFIRVIGKGNIRRIIPVPEDLVNNLTYYLSIYHPYLEYSNYLFYTDIKGHRDKMSPDNIQRITKKYGDMARKIEPTLPRIHPHLFRHSYGAQMYRLGLSLPEIAKLLGHSDLSTTEIYAETDIEVVNQAIEKMIGNQPHNNWELLSEEEKLKIIGLKK